MWNKRTFLTDPRLGFSSSLSVALRIKDGSAVLAKWKASCWWIRKMEPQSTPNTQIGAGRDRLDALSKQIIGCALTVMRTSGAGFLQKVYENALVHELRSAGLGSRNNTAWSFDTTMPGSGTTPWTCSWKTSCLWNG